jgi:Fe-S cluster assembly ATPase SufC
MLEIYLKLCAHIDLLKEKISRARMEQSEIKFKMDNLVQIVKERFNLDLVQVYKDYIVEGFSAGETRNTWQVRIGQDIRCSYDK